MSRKKIVLTPAQEQLFNELRKDVKKANQRLVRLEREFGSDTWSSKRLKTRLDNENVLAFSTAGRIKLNKSMSLNQMRAVKKATELFLKSKTSTNKGVRMVAEDVKKGLKKVLNDYDYTTEDLYTIYEFMSEDAFKDIADKIGASTLAIVIYDTIEENGSYEAFIKKIEQYIDIGRDIDMKNKLNVIYNKFVSQRVKF